MSEQLQKELLDILRSLKDGASPAWQVLVEQRSAYAWASFAIYLLLAGIAALVSTRCIKVFQTKKHEGVEAASCMAAVVTGLACIACALIGSTWLPVAVAPLGGVLGMVVK